MFRFLGGSYAYLESSIRFVRLAPTGFQNVAQFHPRLSTPARERGKIGRVSLRSARGNRNLSGSRSFEIRGRENREQKGGGLVASTIERGDHCDLSCSRWIVSLSTWYSRVCFVENRLVQGFSLIEGYGDRWLPRWWMVVFWKLTLRVIEACVSVRSNNYLDCNAGI